MVEQQHHDTDDESEEQPSEHTLPSGPENLKAFAQDKEGPDSRKAKLDRLAEDVGCVLEGRVATGQQDEVDYGHDGGKSHRERQG